MTEHLVTDVWFGRVERRRVMAYVLRRVERAKREAVEEVARRQQPGDWSQAKAGAVLQEVADVLQLRYLVASVAAVRLQQRQHGAMLRARVRRIERRQSIVHRSPRRNLRLRILNARNLLTTTTVGLYIIFSVFTNQLRCYLLFIFVGNVGKQLTTIAIRFVGEAGMIRVELVAVRENSIRKHIQIDNLARKPNTSANYMCFLVFFLIEFETKNKQTKNKDYISMVSIREFVINSISQ